MKKLLVILMVVAMASFLFVGCLGDGVTPPVDDEDDEDDVTPPTTVAPIIIKIDDGALVNAAEADDGIIVDGTGRTYAEIKLYIDGVLVSSGDVEVDGTWIVVIAKADLGADGAKVLTATATEPGLAESLKSNEVKFTLDTVLPTIDKCSAKAGTPAALDSAVEVSDTSEALLFPPYIPDGIFGIPWFPWLGEYWVVDPTLLVEGTWTLVVKSILDVPPIGLSLFDIITVEATDPTGVKTPFTFSYDGGGAIYQFISGVSCVFEAFSTNDVGHMATVKVTVASAAVPGYIDVTFDEAVTGASILVPPAGTGVWTAFGATEDLDPDVAVWSATTARLTETLGTEWAWWFAWRDVTNLAPGVAYSVSCSGITDLAGNPIPASAPETCMGVVTQ